MATTANPNGAVLGGPKDPPKPTKEQQDKAVAVLAKIRAAQQAYIANKTDANKKALADAHAEWRGLPDLFFSEYGGRRRKTRGSRRKSRGGVYGDTNPIGSPDSRGARQRVVDEATAQRRAELASTAAVGGPLSTIREDGENTRSTTTVKSKEAPRPLLSSLFGKKGARRRITRRR